MCYNQPPNYGGSITFFWQVAMRMQAAYRCGDSHGVTVPWWCYASREEALAAFLDRAKRHFAFPVFGSSKEQMQTQRRMLAMLDGVTVDFKEPEVEVQEEKPEEPGRTHVEKVKERGLVQRELFSSAGHRAGAETAYRLPNPDDPAPCLLRTFLYKRSHRGVVGRDGIAPSASGVSDRCSDC